MHDIRVQRTDTGVVRITAIGEMDHAEAHTLFGTGRRELTKPSCHSLIIDLRATRLLENNSLFKMYKLLHQLSQPSGQRRKAVQTTILYDGEYKRRNFLEMVLNREGIRLKFDGNPHSSPTRQDLALSLTPMQ